MLSFSVHVVLVPPGLSRFVFPSLPPLWLSLSSPNQEIWPLTSQLNAIKVLSIVQLVPPRKM